ncbi:MAG: hypothetical protein U0Z75_06065 [Deinococcaceae bacterium]
MQTVAWVLMGIAIGWIAEWVYDVFLWRKQQMGRGPVGPQEAEAEIQRLMQSIQELRDQLRSAEQSSDRGGVSQAELEASRTEVSDLTGQLSIAMSKIEELSGLSERLYTAESTVHRLQAELEDTVSLDEHMRLKDALETLHSQNTSSGDAAVQQDHVSELQTQLSEEKARFLDAQAQLERLNQELQARASTADSNADVSVLQDRLAEAERELDRLRDDQSRLRDLEYQLSGMVSIQAYEELQNQLNHRVEQEEHLKLQEHAHQLENQLSRLSILEQELESLRIEAQSATTLQAQLGVAEQELEGLRDQLDRMGTDTSVREEVEHLRAKVAEMVDPSVFEDLQEELEQLRLQSQSASGQTAQLLTYIERLREAETEIGVLKAKLEGKEKEPDPEVNTVALGGALDDIFGEIMGGEGDQK